jgi:hypothetical protein
VGTDPNALPSKKKNPASAGFLFLSLLVAAVARLATQVQAQDQAGQGDSGRQVFDNGQHIFSPVD